MKSVLAALLFPLATLPTAVAGEAPSPLPQAHAHNDYEHARPLLDALDQGFCSVEADIHLVDGALLVAHDRGQVKPERTLAALYLDPLLERVRKNGGRVHPGGPGFHLLIDFKSDGAATWAVLRPELERYREMLTVFRDDGTEDRAVTIVLSGNSPREWLAKEPLRRAGIDGRLPDLETNPSPHLVPWISDAWSRHFDWRGNGPFPESERAKLTDIVRRAHAQGRKVRLWGTPDFEGTWAIEREAGADLINTDRLADLRRFLTAPAAGAGAP